MSNKKLPFQVRLLDVSDIAPRAGLVKGEIYDVFAETRKGYEIWSDNYSMPIEMLFSECEKIVPEVNDKRKESKCQVVQVVRVE